MVNVTALQDKINTKIFDNLGSTLLMTSSVITSTDKWGDATMTSPDAISVKAVPWLHIKGRLDYQPFGDLQAGEVDMAFKHDQALAIGYTIVLSGNTYSINEIEEFPLADDILVKVARLRKVH